MKNLFSAGPVVLFLCLVIANASAAEAFKPDADGYIRHWLMLAPISLPEGETGSEAIFKQQIVTKPRFDPRLATRSKSAGRN